MTAVDSFMADIEMSQAELWHLRAAAYLEANPSCAAVDIVRLLEDGVAQARQRRIEASAQKGLPRQQAEAETDSVLQWIREG